MGTCRNGAEVRKGEGRTDDLAVCIPG